MQHSVSAQRYLIINASFDTLKDLLWTRQKSLYIRAQPALLHFVHKVATGDLGSGCTVTYILKTLVVLDTQYVIQSKDGSHTGSRAVVHTK